MLTVIQAEETARAAEPVQVGTLSGDVKVRKEIVGRWNEAKRSHRPPPPRQKATPAMLAAIGIGYRRVQAKKKPT